jgi:hypothetical protein
MHPSVEHSGDDSDDDGSSSRGNGHRHAAADIGDEEEDGSIVLVALSSELTRTNHLKVLADALYDIAAAKTITDDPSCRVFELISTITNSICSARKHRSGDVTSGNAAAADKDWNSFNLLMFTKLQTDLLSKIGSTQSTAALRVFVTVLNACSFAERRTALQVVVPDLLSMAVSSQAAFTAAIHRGLDAATRGARVIPYMTADGDALKYAPAVLDALTTLVETAVTVRGGGASSSLSLVTGGAETSLDNNGVTIDVSELRLLDPLGPFRNQLLTVVSSIFLSIPGRSVGIDGSGTSIGGSKNSISSIEFKLSTEDAMVLCSAVHLLRVLLLQSSLSSIVEVFQQPAGTSHMADAIGDSSCVESAFPARFSALLRIITDIAMFGVSSLWTNDSNYLMGSSTDAAAAAEKLKLKPTVRSSTVRDDGCGCGHSHATHDHDHAPTHVGGGGGGGGGRLDPPLHSSLETAAGGSVVAAATASASVTEPSDYAAVRAACVYFLQSMVVDSSSTSPAASSVQHKGSSSSDVNSGDAGLDEDDESVLGTSTASATHAEEVIPTTSVSVRCAVAEHVLCRMLAALYILTGLTQNSDIGIGNSINVASKVDAIHFECEFASLLANQRSTSGLTLQELPANTKINYISHIFSLFGAVTVAFIVSSKSSTAAALGTARISTAGGDGGAAHYLQVVLGPQFLASAVGALDALEYGGSDVAVGAGVTYDLTERNAVLLHCCAQSIRCVTALLQRNPVVTGSTTVSSAVIQLLCCAGLERDSTMMTNSSMQEMADHSGSSSRTAPMLKKQRQHETSDLRNDFSDLNECVVHTFCESISFRMISEVIR